MSVDDWRKSAIGNWVWLADMPNMRDALIVGESARAVAQGLQQHFDQVRIHEFAGEAGDTLPFDPQSFDCVVLGDAVGEAVVSETLPAGPRLLCDVRRILRVGGCLFLPVVHLRKRTPRVLAKPLRRSGFAEIRPIYVSGSFHRPGALIPARRSNTTFVESWTSVGLRGKLKVAIALGGAHHVMQSSLVLLAYR